MSTVTKTIGTTGRDYATITLWEADLDNVAVYSSGDDAVGECYNDSVFNEKVTITGSGETIGLNSLRLSVAEGERHNGTAGTGARIVLSGSPSAGHCIKLDTNLSGGQIVEWLEVDAGGLLIQNENGVQISAGCNTADRTKNVARNMIVHDCHGNRFNSGIRSENRPATIMNCIVYDIGGDGSLAGSGQVYGIGGDDKLDILNCTVYNVKYNADSTNVYGIGNIEAGGSANVKNNIVMDVANTGAGDGDCYQVADATFTNCISSDDTGTIINKVTADQFVNIGAGTEDLHLKAGSDAIDAGADLGTALQVNIDINGRDRDAEGDTWDIGAHEFADGGGGGLGVLTPMTKYW